MAGPSLDLDAQYVPRPEIDINATIYRNVISEKNKKLFRPTLSGPVESNLERLVSRVKMNPGRFKASWVVGDRGSGKTQMLLEVCYRLINEGSTKRWTKRTKDVIVPVFLPVPAGLISSVQSFDPAGADKFFGELMKFTRMEILTVFLTLLKCMKEGSLKRNSRLGTLALALDEGVKNLKTMKTEEFLRFLHQANEIGVRPVFIFDDFDKVDAEALGDYFSFRQTEFQAVAASIVISARESSFPVLKGNPGLNYMLATSSHVGSAPDEFHLPHHPADPKFVREALKSRLECVHLNEASETWVFLPEKGKGHPWKNPDWPFSGVDRKELQQPGLDQIILWSQRSLEPNSMRMILRFAEHVLESSSGEILKGPQVGNFLQNASKSADKILNDFVEEAANPEDNSVIAEYARLSDLEDFKDRAHVAFDCLRFLLPIDAANEVDSEIEISSKKGGFASEVMKLFSGDDKFVEDSTSSILTPLFDKLDRRMHELRLEQEGIRQEKKRERKEGEAVSFDELGAPKGSNKRTWLETLSERIQDVSDVDVFTMGEASSTELESALHEFAKDLHDLLNLPKNLPNTALLEDMGRKQLINGWKEFFRLRGMNKDPAWGFLRTLLEGRQGDASELVKHVPELMLAAQRPPLPDFFWDNFEHLAISLDSIFDEDSGPRWGPLDKPIESGVLSILDIRRAPGKYSSRKFIISMSVEQSEHDGFLDTINTALGALDKVHEGKRHTEPIEMFQITYLFEIHLSHSFSDTDTEKLLRSLTKMSPSGRKGKLTFEKDAAAEFWSYKFKTKLKLIKESS